MPFITTSQGTAFYTNAHLGQKDVLSRNYDKDEGQAGITVPGRLSRGNLLPPTASRAYFTRFVVTRSMTITVIAFNVTTFSATDDAVDVGIYTAAGARLVSSGATTGKVNTANGVKTIAITATPLVPRTAYYAAFAYGASAAPATVTAALWTDATITQLYGATMATGIEICQKDATPTLPDPITSVLVNASQVPVMALRES